MFATATFLLAGTIKGAVGIGLPTASIGILTQVLDPLQAMALVIFPLMISNAWQAWRMGDLARVGRAYWKLAASMMVVMWLTTFVTASISQTTLLVIVGTAVVIFAVNSLAFKPPRLPDRYDAAAQWISGSASGVIGGLTAIWSPPMVSYLIARRLEKDEFVRVTGLLLFLGSVPLCIGFWQQGLFGGRDAAVSAAMVVPALAGFRLGEGVRRRISTGRFQTVLLLVFLIMGLNIVRKAVTGM